jgi:primosomal protein N' (replication factor Y)
MVCRHCSVALTYHRGRERMICHYCGFSTQPIRACPQCGSLDVGYAGYGTEGIEEEIQRTFPRMTVRRIDTDTMKKRKLLRDALADFREGRTHLLLGTQMVAKGLNFPGVKLVGIVNADTGFQMPDFRAAERTFDLLVQVSGRAGRTLPDGKVLIQTMRPDNPAIVLAREGRLADFYSAELDTRRQLAFPPYSRLIRLVVRGRVQSKAVEASGELGRRLVERVGDAAEILGPAECPIARISGSFRSHLLVRTTRFSQAHERVAAALDCYKAPSGVHVEVDVDPLALL